MFNIQNRYPVRVTKQIMKKVKENSTLATLQSDAPLENNNNNKIRSIMLPFARAEDNTILKSKNSLYPTMLTH